MSPLETELKTYADALPELLANSGKYVVIHQAEIGGIYDTYNDALKFGYEKYGLNPFLVKQISATEQVSFFTRDLAPCQISA